MVRVCRLQGVWVCGYNLLIKNDVINGEIIG